MFVTRMRAKKIVAGSVHVRKGDTVMVIAGKSAGKKGKVLEVYPTRSRLLVEGVNLSKRHTKPTTKIPQGGILEKESPLHCSNVMLICPRCESITRVGHKILAKGEKVRCCKKCGEVIDK